MDGRLEWLLRDDYVSESSCRCKKGFSSESKGSCVPCGGGLLCDGNTLTENGYYFDLNLIADLRIGLGCLGAGSRSASAQSLTSARSELPSVRHVPVSRYLNLVSTVELVSPW